MTAYYNEYDKHAAAWLRQLITDGLIAPGTVDERSIADVRAEDLRGYTQCHFFAGIGGWSYALRIAGWSDGRPIWTGSCPCQPFSAAGKQKGAKDERHLWPEFFRLIRQCQPAIVAGEQVAAAIGHGWLDGVFADLETEGYACGAAVLGAHSVGAPHIRQRLYWLADRNNAGSQRRPGVQKRSYQCPAGKSGMVGGMDHAASSRCDREVGKTEGDSRDSARMRMSRESSENRRMADMPSERRDGRPAETTESAGRRIAEAGRWDGVAHLCRDGKHRRIPAQPAFFPLVDGLPPARVGILRGAGNAIVPQVAAAFMTAYCDVANT